MKKKLNSITIFLLFALALFSLMAFTSVYRAVVNPIIELPSKGIVTIPIEPVTVNEMELIVTSHQAFLDAIGFRESGNRYDIVNSFGYMGKYQFGKSTLKGLGFKVTQEEFLNSPELQEQAMQELLRHNKKKLKRFIKKYDGKVVHGVLITESGILAAAHLAGQGNVRKFFRNGYEFKDGFGTKMTSYMEMFGGYNLNV
jgi:hypothetical protein